MLGEHPQVVLGIIITATENKLGYRFTFSVSMSSKYSALAHLSLTLKDAEHEDQQRHLVNSVTLVY